MLHFPQEQDITDFNEETLYKYFRKYGQIESIEILEPKTRAAKKTKKLEAYVTFERDISASTVVFYTENRIQLKREYKYNVLPANTWKQPSEPNMIDESMVLDEDEGYASPIFMLNEDCFEELFHYLDIDSLKNLLEVCKKFNVLVHKHGFKRIKSYDYKPDRTTLAQMRRQLKYTGKYIINLKFTCQAEQNHRFYDILGKYVGKNIRHAVFRIEYLNDRFITAFKPIFRNLLSLEFNFLHSRSGIYCNYDFDMDLFQRLCPNLIKLKWNCEKLNCKRKNMVICNNKSWPKLQSLAIGFGTYPSALQVLLQQNPQITTLRLSAGREEIQYIAAHLPNIQQLIIRLQSHWNADNIRPLAALSNLTTLKLISMKNNQVVGTLNCLKQFRTLRELVLLSVYDEEYDLRDDAQLEESLITLARKLSHLESINLIDINLRKSTVLKFIHFAKNLKEIHILFHRSLASFFTQPFILELVEELKSSRSQCTTQPLKIFVQSRNIVKFDAIQEHDIENYLHIIRHPKQFQLLRSII